jgi:hypothetical protein
MAERKRMTAFAREVATRDGGAPIALPSRAVAVGDPVTNSLGRIDVGVEACTAWLDEMDDDDERVVIVARVRSTAAVRWEARGTGGVDAGLFGLWDANTRSSDDATSADVASVVGSAIIGGRHVFAIATGDGVFPCVVGFDRANDICAIVTGPGVDAERFGATTPDELKEPWELAREAEARANVAKLESADVLTSRLGDKACPVTRIFVAGVLGDADADARAALTAAIDSHLDAFAIPTVEKKARARIKARFAVVLAWAIENNARLLGAVMPEEAATLAAMRVDMKGKLEWAAPLARIYDHRSSDRKFDLSRAFGSDALVALALADVPESTDPRLGLSGLDALVRHLELKEPESNALWYARAGMLRAIELHVLATRAADVDGPALHPRDPAYVDALIATIVPPSTLIDRLAHV